MSSELSYAKSRYPLAMHFLSVHYDIALLFSFDEMTAHYLEDIAGLPEVTESQNTEKFKMQLKEMLSDENIDWLAITDSPEAEIFYPDIELPKSTHQDQAKAYVKKALWDPLQ
jgi:hypothetical protein